MRELPLLRLLPWVLMSAAVAGVGFSGDVFLMSVACITMLWIALSGALNLVMGYGGLFNFGIGAMYGIGAYTVAVLDVRTSVPWFAALIVAMCAAGLVAAVLAPLVLRTRGLYFAIASLALGMVAIDLFTNLVDLTGGPLGLSVQRPSFIQSDQAVYWFMAAFTLVIMGFFALFHRSRMAGVLRAANDDEQLTTALGYRVLAYRIGAFVISSAVAGLAGGLYAYFIRYVSPTEFTLMGAAFQAFTIVALGGGATLWGPVVGAVLLTGVPTFVEIDPHVKSALYGAALLLVVLVVPEGVVKGAQRLIRVGLRRHERPPDPRSDRPPPGTAAPHPESFSSNTL